MQYRYSDGTTGATRQVTHDGQVYPAFYLTHRATETEAEWRARIAEIEVMPVKEETWTGDPNTQDQGEAVETETDGWIVISYPHTTDKTPVYNKSTREVMYVAADQTVPDTYTSLEPVDGIYSTWSGEAWTYNTALKAAHVRAERDRLLTACDGQVMQLERRIRLATAAGEDPTALIVQLDQWDTYREQLCDVPNQAGFPMDINWPEEPA